MGRKSCAKRARDSTMDLARSVKLLKCNNVDSNNSKEVEPATVTSISTSKGYDILNSTREIFTDLERQVQEEQEGIQLNEDIPTKSTKTSSRNRYRGSLIAYDNMSSEDIVMKYTNLSRKGSKMYSVQVWK